MRKWVTAASPLIFGLCLFLLSPASSASRPRCPEFVLKIKRLYAARDPSLLTLDLLKQGCRPAELYQTAYYQGFAFFFTGRNEDARIDFQLALSLSGPWDEQLLQHLWIVQGRLGDQAGQRATLEELRSRFPASASLKEVEAHFQEPWDTRKGGYLTTDLSWLEGELDYQGLKGNSLAGVSFTHAKSAHILSEHVDLSGNLSLAGQGQHFYGMEAGVAYQFQGFSMRAHIGPLYSTYIIPREFDGPGGAFADSSIGKWEASLRASISQSIGLPKGWSSETSLNHYRQGRSFVTGINEDFDRRHAGNTLRAGLAAEYQVFSLEDACIAVGQAVGECGDFDILAFQASGGWGHEAQGRAYDADLFLRYEDFRHAPEWRLLANWAGRFSVRLFGPLRASTGLDFGWEWRKGGDDPVLGARLAAEYYY